MTREQMIKNYAMAIFNGATAHVKDANDKVWLRITRGVTATNALLTTEEVRQVFNLVCNYLGENDEPEEVPETVAPIEGV